MYVNMLETLTFGADGLKRSLYRNANKVFNINFISHELASMSSCLGVSIPECKIIKLQSTPAGTPG